MASGITPAKKLVIRTSLVTGSTLALIVGAQSLITLDLQKTPSISTTTTTSSVAEAASPSPSQTTVISAPPSIVILRHPSVPGTPAAKTNANAAPVQHTAPVVNAPVIQPPAPVMAQAPAAVIVQGPAQGSAPSAPSTHSTR